MQYTFTAHRIYRHQHTILLPKLYLKVDEATLSRKIVSKRFIRCLDFIRCLIIPSRISNPKTNAETTSDTNLMRRSTAWLWHGCGIAVQFSLVYLPSESNSSKNEETINGSAEIHLVRRQRKDHTVIESAATCLTK